MVWREDGMRTNLFRDARNQTRSIHSAARKGGTGEGRNRPAIAELGDDRKARWITAAVPTIERTDFGRHNDRSWLVQPVAVAARQHAPFDTRAWIERDGRGIVHFDSTRLGPDLDAPRRAIRKHDAADAGAIEA